MSSLHFAQIETALGPMLVAWTDAGLAALEGGEALEPFVAALRRRFRDRPMEPGRPPPPLRRELEEYLAGTRQGFDLSLDLAGVTDFDARVYRAAMAIPYGKTATYGDLAARIGAPRVARAVGGAMSRCPFFPIVPCHRVVRAADGFSGWGGDLSVKRRLLDLESRVARGRP